MIPLINDVEVTKIKSELLNVQSIGVSFDGTTEVAEVMNIVIRFVSRTCKISQRVIALKLLKKSPNAAELTAFIVEILFTRYGCQPSHIHSICRDGAAVNTAACDTLKHVLNQSVFPICICHSVAVAGYCLNQSVNVARVFISCWAIMIAHSGTARMKFQEYAGVKAKRVGHVRWFTFWEVGAQLQQYYEAAKFVVNDADNFAEESRQTLRLYMNNPVEEKTLKLELALIKDCEFLVQFCYFQEGDGFLSVTTYNHFESVMSKLENVSDDKNPQAPYVSALITSLNLGIDASTELLLTTTAKAKNVLAKLKYDTNPNERLGPTMAILRACRYWDYKWVASVPLIALQEEIVQIHRVAGISETLRNNIIRELNECKRLADLETLKPTNTQIDLWNFFIQHKFHLPFTYCGACEVAIIMPSSATSERVFAMYSVLFGELDQRALEDMRETSVMLRMNRNWRIKEEN